MKSVCSRNRILWSVLLGCGLLAAMMAARALNWPRAVWAGSSAGAAVLMVTNNNDSGSGSLRQAILDANAMSGQDTINFSIGAGPQTISPASALPIITGPVTIQGATQPGFAGAPLIEINGANAGETSGLVITGGGSIVSGLVINRFNGNGLVLGTNGGNTVTGCYIGTNLAGSAALPNTIRGILVSSGGGNTIGGATIADRNVISGNGNDGIDLNGPGVSGTVIQGNYIGVNAAGTAALGNGDEGIAVADANATNTQIIGNVISASASDGIEIGGAPGTIIQGNFIGTDAAGTLDFGNASGGISASGAATGLVIGGASVAQRNVIAGNNGGGILLSVIFGAVVQGNYIGVGADGLANAGNGGDGVACNNASDNSITGNVIANQAAHGVHIITGGNNLISGNSIFANAGQGIALDPAGVTPNDACDTDTGANTLQNFPVLTSVTVSGGTTTIQGTYNSTASNTFTIELFANAACDSGGHGEGETYLGQTTVTTNASCTGNFSVTLPVVLTAGQMVTATGTPPNGNTSEFSACFQYGQAFLVTNTADSGAASLRQAIIDANASAAAPKLIAFNIPTADPGFSGGVFTIQPASQLPTLVSNIVLDGTTQTAFTGNTNANGPEIVVNGALQSGGSGLILDDGNTVKGLVINGFTDVGVLMTWNFSSGGTANNNQILDNYIGTNPSGTAAVPNAVGVSIHGFGSPGSQSSGNLVQGNLISGNNGVGVDLCDAASNQVRNNLIGTDRTGTGNLGNGGHGIFLVCAGAPNNLFETNTIAFNQKDGIRDEPDYRFGIAITANGHQGNRFKQNSIFSNGELGLNLLKPPYESEPPNTVQPNDACDADTGGNLLQNFPVITELAPNGANTTINGTLDSVANQTFEVELFANGAADATGHGEGQIFLGAVSVTTAANCNGSFSLTVPSALVAGKQITATATDGAGNSSEFSIAFPIICPAITVHPAAIAAGATGVAYNQSFTQSGAVNVTFSLSGALPAGMSFANGALSGTPTQTGNFPVTVTATNAVGCTGSRGYLLVVGTLAASQSPAWIELATTGAPPHPVGGPKPVHYDALNNRLIAFFPGNPPFNGNPPGNGNEVWILTHANGLGGAPQWVELQPTGLPPSSNGQESVVYDAAANCLIVYGGCLVNCSPARSDVFVLTNANGLGGAPVWTQSTVTNPQARVGHSSVFDALNNLMISFAGHQAFFGTDQNDTRLLSNANGTISPSTWTTLSTTGGPPPIRNEHTAIYDQVSNRMTVFAGHNLITTCCPYVISDYNDLWLLANANGLDGAPAWTQVTTGSAPPVRSGHSAVYDPVNNRMLVFGGAQWNQAAQTTTPIGDLWQLSHANGLGGAPAWSQIPQSCAAPGPRFSHTAAFDAANQRMIVLGGRDVNDQASNRVWVLVPNCASVSISPTTLAEGVTGAPYSQNFTASDSSGPYTFNLTGSLPNGMTFANGALSGTPTQSGSFSFGLTATDQNGCSGCQSYTLVVNCPAITLTPATLPVPTVGTPYCQTIVANGGAPPYSFMLVSGALPPGLSLSTDGMLCGTPSAVNTYNFTIQATDANGCTGTQAYSITINPPPNCVPPPSGMVSWWTGDGNANDLIGGNHGMLQNGATFAAGLVGQAFSFVGPDDIVRVPHNSNLNVGTGDVTIDAWTQLSNLTFTNDRVIMAKYSTNPSDTPFPGYIFRWLGGTLQFIIDSELGEFGPSVQDKKVEATITRDTNWHHVAAVRRGLAMELFYDGVLVATATHSSMEAADNTADVGIGNAAGSLDNGFPGLIDELEFFNRALSASEVAALFNAGSAGKCNNNPPTITAADSPARQQGSAGILAPIATVNDTETPRANLVVTVMSAPTGISITSISAPNATTGEITATVAADCTAATGANTVVLKVTDSNSGTATANLTVNVTANTAPLLTYTGPQNVLVGGALNVTPSIGPSDNSSIASLVVQSVTPSGFTGSITVNGFGVVAISNAGPDNSYTVTIRATDNCGATTDAGFRLAVKEQACAGISLTSSAIGVGGLPMSLAISDLNLDGQPDLAVANVVSSNVTILLGNGAGGFSQATGSPVSVGTNPRDIVAGDFDLDGKPDLAVANEGSNSVTILIGNGSGGFAQAAGSPVSVGTQPLSLVMGDFNLDGRPDLAVANHLSNNVTILLGNGGGGFAPVAGSPISAGSLLRQVVTGDFNLDGKPDLAVANGGSNNVTILLGDGAGGFLQAAGSPISVGGEPHGLALGDFNLDGKPDLATANTASDDITILLGNGAGEFSPAAGSPLTVGDGPISVTVGDLNLDGKSDLAVANHVSNNITILVGNGSGGFTQPSGSPLGGALNHSFVAAGDLNLDGKPDLAVANRLSDNVTTLLNTCTSNTAPMIAATSIPRTAGSLSANSQIATVTDAQDALNSLAVTVNGGASATHNGVTVSGLSVNAAGVVTADVVAACGATDASFTLRVTDSGGLFAEAALNVTVNPNPPPTLTYAAVSVSAGGATSNSPTAASDNGIITGYTLQNVGTYTGTISVNAAGVVSISNAAPVGTHTITIRATDNCGATTDATFVVSVNGQPVITASAVTVKQGSPSANFMIGNASDPNQAANTLTVTVNGGASATVNGVTISNLTIDNSGNLKADIVAACAATNASFTLRVTDSNGLFAEAVLTVEVTPNMPPTVGNYANTLLLAGSSATITPDAAPTDNGSIQSVTAAASPNTFTGTFSGNTATGAVTITNANPPDTYTITVTVTDNCGATAQKTFTLTVCPVITINPPSLPNGVMGQAYNQTITQTGGVTPIDFSLSAGALPPGLTLDAATGALAGTPSQAGNFTFTVKATDANGCMGTRQYSVAISAPPPSGGWSVQSSGTANALASVHFVNDTAGWAAGVNATLLKTTNGGNWAPCSTGVAAGNGFNSVRFLDANLGFAGGGKAARRITDGCASGNTTVFNDSDFRNRWFPTSATTVWAVGVGPFQGNPQCRKAWRHIVNGSGFLTIEFQFNGCISTSAPLDVYFTDPDNGWMVGVGGAIQRITNGTAPFPSFPSQNSGTAQNLNGVFMLDTNTGWVVGNNGTILKTSNGGTNWTAQTSNTNVNLNDVHFVNASQGWVVGNGGTILFTGDGGATWTPEISPTTQDLFSLFFTNPSAGYAVGANGAIIKRAVCPAITVAPASLSAGTANQSYSQTFTASGGAAPYTFNLSGALPAGLSFDSGAATLSGTPAQTGSFNVTVTATDTNGCTGSQTYSLLINCPAITITPASLPAGMAGTPYSQQLIGNGGQSPYSFTVSAGSLPNGIMLSSEGLLSGTPTGIGTFNFTVQATDANNCTGTQIYAMVINPACGTINVNPASLPNGFAGTAYNQALTGSGGTAPYTFTVSAGTLPSGLNLSSGGILSGTPTAASTFNFTVKATDTNGCMGTRDYTAIISGSGLQFYPLTTPVRLLETRTGFSGCTNPGNPINANDTFTLPARTPCAGIPANAAAVTGNITVVPSAGGFLTLFPSTATQPTVANSNFAAGEITNNVFTVGLGAGDGAFKIFTNATTHLIVDVTGYYAPPGVGGLYFHPLSTPVRLLETRTGFTGCFAPGTPLTGTGDPNADPNLDLALQGRSPIPSPCNSIPATAQVLVGNATSVLPSGGGYLTIYPSGGTRPTVASSNYAGGDVINGPFAVKLGADGKFKVYTFASTHLVIDILGYYSEEATDANGAGLLFNPLPSPVRLLETRPDFPGFPLAGCTRTNARIPGNLASATHTQSAGGFCGLPASAQAVVGNVSVVNSEGAGFLTLFPANLTTAPLVATSNYPAPATFGYNRHYFVGLSPTDGKFKVLTQFTTDLILDASGYFAP